MSVQIDSKQALIAAILFSIMGVFAMMIGPVMITSLIVDLGFDEGQASLILAIEYLGIALASICAAFWLNRVSWKAAGALAASVIVVGNIVSGMQTSFEVLAVVRFLVGFLGEGVAFVIGIAVVSSTKDQQRNFGFVIASQVAFGVAANYILPNFFIPTMQFGGIMYPLAALALVFAFAVIWLPSGAAAPGADGDQAAAAGGGSVWPAVIALIAMFVWCTGLGAIWNFVSQIAIEGGLTRESAGNAIAISSACAILGGIIASAIGARFGSFVPVAAAITVQVIMIWFLQGDFSFWQFVATAAVFQIFWNITGPFLMGAVSILDPKGQISVMIPAAQIGGLFLGLAIAGSAIGPGDLSPANQIAIACCILALLIFAPIGLKMSKPAAEASA